MQITVEMYRFSSKELAPNKPMVTAQGRTATGEPVAVCLFDATAVAFTKQIFALTPDDRTPDHEGFVGTFRGGMRTPRNGGPDYFRAESFDVLTGPRLEIQRMVFSIGAAKAEADAAATPEAALAAYQALAERVLGLNVPADPDVGFAEEAVAVSGQATSVAEPAPPAQEAMAEALVAPVPVAASDATPSEDGDIAEEFQDSGPVEEPMLPEDVVPAVEPAPVVAPAPAPEEPEAETIEAAPEGADADDPSLAQDQPPAPPASMSGGKMPSRLSWAPQRPAPTASDRPAERAPEPPVAPVARQSAPLPVSPRPGAVPLARSPAPLQSGGGQPAPTAPSRSLPPLPAPSIAPPRRAAPLPPVPPRAPAAPPPPPPGMGRR